MVKKILKGIGWTLLILVVSGLSFYLYVSLNINARLEKAYNVEKSTVEIPSDSASLANGAHLVAIKGCTDCHGNSLEGKIMNDDPLFGRLVATNLTKGKGGLPQDYRTEDWMKAFRHGLNRNNTPLIFMPSAETAQLSEGDLKSLIAYLDQLPPVDNELPKMDLGFLAEILGYFDVVPLIPAEKIDHNAPLIKSVDRSSPVAFGKYLAIFCSACHKPTMKGGEPAGPGMPPVPDLTSTGATGRWTLEQFNHALRTGERPDAKAMNNDEMPWKMTAQYTDEEISALYEYFKSLK